MANVVTKISNKGKSVVAKAPKIDIRAQLKEQLTSFHHSLEDALKSDKTTRYVTSADGIMEVRSNEIGVFIVKASKIAGAEKIKEAFTLNLPKKIPYEIFLQTISFFRGVADRFSNSEAALQIFWDRSKEEYFVYCPKQEVAGSTVDFTRDPVMEQEHLLVMDIHSHNTMGAFFSATDNKDEKETRLFGVIGKIKDEVPEFKFRAVCAGNHIDNIKLFDIFENPFDDVAVPNEWYDQVSKKVYTHVNTVGRSYGYPYWQQSGIVGASSVSSVVDKGKKHKSKTKGQKQFSDAYSYAGSEFDDEFDYESYYEQAYAHQDAPRYPVSKQEGEIIEGIVNNLSEDSVMALIERLADEGYDLIIERALYSKI